MIDLLPEFLINEPRRLITLGHGLVRTAALILMLGAFGQVATAGSSALVSMGGHRNVDIALADLYPSIPTWFVPESLMGCLPVALLIVLGLCAISLGKDLLRFT